MRACMVAYTFYEEDNRVRRYAETLVDHGWNVDVFVLRTNGQSFKSVIKGVNVHRIQKRVLNEKGRLTYLYRTMKFLMKSFFLVSKKQLLNKYDIVHIHSIPDYEIFAAILPKFSGSKIILDIHDLVPELYTAKFIKKDNTFLFKVLLLLEKLSTSFADYVIIANHIWYERLIQRSVNDKKCSVIMNYPDEKIFGNTKRDRKDEDFLIVYPGALSKHQGIDIAIKAISILKNEIPQIRFHIYGDGTDKKYLQELAQTQMVTKEVKFFDSVPLEEIAQIMANADIGVEPKLKNSFSDEAFSTKILEFMLLRIPVIVSDTTVHQYYFDSKVVRFFEAGNYCKLAECIKLLYYDKELRKQYIQNANEFIEQMMWGKRKTEYMAIIKKLLNNKVIKNKINLHQHSC